jgi:P-type Cu+ transporter
MTSETMTEQTLRLLIDGMHCGNCALNVENHLKELNGVKEVSVSLASNSGKVIFDPSVTNEDEILGVFDGLSFDAMKAPENNRAKVLKERKLAIEKKRSRDVRDFSICAIITIIVVCICMVPGAHMEVGKFLYNSLGGKSVSSAGGNAMASHMFCANVLVMILTIPVQFVFGWRFYKGAIDSIKSKMANMDVLVASGTTIAFLFSVYITFFDQGINEGMPYFETCCMLVTFVMLGKILESRAKDQAGEAIEKLMELTPEKVRAIKKDGSVVELEIDDVFPGELLVVGKGENFAVDGAIRKGETKVDESMLTGESELIDKKKGDEVSAGTVNLGSEVVIIAKSVGADTQLSKIISAVEDAQASKPSVQRLADKIAGIFVPCILLVAVATFFGWCLFSSSARVNDVGQIAKMAILPAISVICVACPCALGLATPTALMVGMGVGAGKGILIKDGDMLERACEVDTCVFDKTGTLTTGVVDNVNVDEKTSVVTNDVIKPDAEIAISTLEGMGIACWMVSGDKTPRAEKIAEELGIDASNVVSRVLPTEKGEVVEKIKDGDLGDGSRVIAFVGDGINDAPALAKADVSIAMGSGADVAIGACSIVLKGNHVIDVVRAIDLSRATMRKIKQNLFWALIYNLIMVPLAMFGILAPAVAGAAMALSSVTVVSNSLLLKRVRLP